jgi:hypothetical protein
MTLTKIDASEQQLNTAIRLFFENRDHLSSYALVVASREVTDDLIQNQYEELYRRELLRVGDPQRVRLSYREDMKDRINPKFYVEFLKLDRERQNFLKHADKDPNAEIGPFTARFFAFVIIRAILNYTLLTQRWPFEMQTFLFGSLSPSHR